MKIMRYRSLFLSIVSYAAMATAGSAMAQTQKGDQIFKQRCQACHTVKPGAAGMLGPNLSGVVGRKAGATEFRYSLALKAANIKWDATSLDRFLNAPTKLVPGTRMVVSVSDAAQRKAIVDYLATIP
jgi:cytochrome c